MFFTGAVTPLFLTWPAVFLDQPGYRIPVPPQFGEIFQLYRFNATFDTLMLLKTALLVLLLFVFVFGINQYFQ